MTELSFALSWHLIPSWSPSKTTWLSPGSMLSLLTASGVGTEDEEGGSTPEWEQDRRAGFT